MYESTPRIEQRLGNIIYIIRTIALIALIIGAWAYTTNFGEQENVYTAWLRNICIPLYIFIPLTALFIYTFFHTLQDKIRASTLYTSYLAYQDEESQK
jgi:TRAP-type C4-dicarboxylate transport system permease small subunit